MTGRENLIAALTNNNPEWIPWTPLIDYANVPCFVNSDVLKSGEKDLYDLALYYQEELQCDILINADPVRGCFRKTKVTTVRDKDIVTTRLELDGEVLTRRIREVKVGGMDTSAIIEYFLKDENDLLIYEKILNDTYLEYNKAEFEKITKKIGDRGLVNTIGPRTPITKLIIELMGIENFTYVYEDEPELVDRVIKKMHEIAKLHYKMILESGLDFEFVLNFEDQDILLTSPETYRKYIFPMMKEYCDMTHKAGKLYMMHACGHVKPFLNMIKEAEIDAHHYLSDAPVGDTSPGEARAIWNDKINIMAAIDPLLLAEGTPQQVKDNLLSILNQLKGGNFLIMSAMKPDIPEENLRIIQKTMREVNGLV